MANDTPYGLAASVITGNVEKAFQEVVPKIDSGNVAVNSWTFETMDFRLPFGGAKCSGIGRELGPGAIKEFINEKTYYLKL